MRELTSQTRSQVTPLVELVPSVDNAPSKVSEEVLRNWGFSPFFLDLGNLAEMERADALVRLSEGMRASGLRAIPVTGLDRESSYQTKVAEVAAADRRGACVRLYRHNLASSSLAEDLHRLLTALALRPAEVDLIVDYQLISDFAMPYTMLCQRIPYLSQWRTFTVISGAFSQDLTEYQKNGQYTRFPHSPGTSHLFSLHLQLVYVLHAFQKKSKKGIATPKTDVDLIKKRLGLAEQDYKTRSTRRGRNK